MAMKRTYWKGISRGERQAAMAEIRQIVDRHAIILNFQRFSDVALSLVLEVTEAQVPLLYAALQEKLQIEGLVEEMTDSDRDCLVFVHITFAQGSGDYSIEVPDIPQ